MRHNLIPRSATRQRVTVCALVALFTSSIAVAVVFGSSSETAPDAARLSPLPTEASLFSRPADWAPYRPAVHLTPAKHWMNDPQRPILIDGVWHYYYLYNADYPQGNGTEWYHATSTDLVHWQEHGVAIDKYKNGLGDIETGSAVIDTNNTAGFGAGAVIAIMTQQHEGVQRQSLFVSTDGGYRFEAYDGNPVMDNPGADHWRDPKIIWDDARDEWLMALAEGHKIGFYTSPDLKRWTYQSGFERDDLGILECPDLFRMSVDGDPAKTRWVLATGANGFKKGRTTGTVYWTGDWDGERFTADQDEPRWLDSGADFYATVTWDDPRQNDAERLASRYAIGWLNNWAYATRLPTDDWHGGANSIVRRIELRLVNGKPVLVSQPVNTVDQLEGNAEVRSKVRVTATAKTTLPQPESDAYRLRVELDAASDANEVRFRLKEKGEHFAIVGYNFADDTVFVMRDRDAIANSMPEVYREVRKAPAPARDGVVTLDIIVDTTSIEVFVNDGEVVLSNLVFGAHGANSLSVESFGGDTELRLFQLSPLKVAPIKRYGGEL
ncbi:glycoside hydrolase family 32 protein [Marinobacterium rhizophilum]|uniref:glycoside hydrolase family 32 protein n=1 Tax=Marinobacterium rhizophilum TaxID=420402 RepID=UPI000686C8CA|nr:glycoside hydrolase family 32 protein [Marinobacterium rhizophilum]